MAKCDSILQRNQHCYAEKNVSMHGQDGSRIGFPAGNVFMGLDKPQNSGIPES